MQFQSVSSRLTTHHIQGLGPITSSCLGWTLNILSNREFFSCSNSYCIYYPMGINLVAPGGKGEGRGGQAAAGTITSTVPNLTPRTAQYNVGSFLNWLSGIVVPAQIAELVGLV
jgi:hypothetical protein